MSRYVIIGAGAVGVTLGVELSRAGRSVVLVARGRQLDLLRSGGVQYFRPDRNEVVDLPVVGGPDELHLEKDDILVVATKTQDADPVLSRWAAEPVGDGAKSAGEALPVFTMQNGLDTERSALRRFDRVIGSVLWVPSTYVVDGEILSPGFPAVGIFWLGDYPDKAPSTIARQIASDLVDAGFEVQVVDDLLRWKAAKLISSSAFVLDALYPRGPERDRAAQLVQAEARDVLEAAGWQPADVQAESTVRFDRLATQPIGDRARPGSSTLQSLARGRRAETDYLNGEVVLIARQLGRRAPLSAALLGAIQQIERSGEQPGTLSYDHLAQLVTKARVLVDPETLQSELAGPIVPALVDVRWTLGDPDGERYYLDGHLPGAVFADLDKELASEPSPTEGRHPLPSVEILERAAQRWGVRDGQPIVVYDNNGGLSAARAWWLLRWAGITDVRILDGGLSAWQAFSGGLETIANHPTPGDVHLNGGHLPVVGADDVADTARHGVLLDARAEERYRGEIEPIDPRAGHIPGAVSLPTGGNLDGRGAFLPVAELRERFAKAGIDFGPESPPIAVYCGSGVTAAHEIAALEAAGIAAALYPGSWSAWSADANRPIVVGPDPF